MGTFISQGSTPSLWTDKAAAPGLVYPQGLDSHYVWRADDAAAVKAALLDIRTHLRGAGIICPTDSAYGAVGDDSTDNTDAFLAAIAAAKAGNYRRILLPPGIFRISGTLAIADTYGLTFCGAARDRCILKWTGSSGSPMVLLKNTQHVTVEGMQLLGNTAGGNRPSAAIESSSDTTYARTYVPTGTVLRDLVIGTGSANEFTYGVKYSHTGTSSDTNNSEGFFQGVLIQGLVEAGYSFEHSQSKAHRIVGGGVVLAKCAVATNRGSGSQGGSFSWVEAAASSCSEACFDFGGSNDPIYIERLTSEGSARLLQTGGPAGNTFGITLQSCRYATDALHADNNAIVYKYRGPLNIIGCNFDSGGNPANIALTFNTDGVCQIMGNAFNSIGSSLTSRIVIGGGGDPGHIKYECNVFADGAGAMVAQAHCGTFTVADAATTGSATFNIPEHDTAYRLSIEPVTLSGSPSAGASRVRSIAKTTSGFTATVEAAPGAGTSVTFDWVLVRV